ncbi:MAG: hypothetical protein LGR52_08690 [Candidatus Thiosymbion ectosymbiont of Robbea hypermnestra]|nr:hypothetical protein [Candidatus Thiosymbion ectosymbiont of Robbea hypermnestra]
MANLLRRSLKAIGSGLRAGWLLVGIVLILVILSEGGLRLALTARDWLLDRPLTEAQVTERKIDRLAGADAYRDAPWARDYFQEYETAKRLVWESYVYWRHAPYQGRYINVNRKGLRATWNPLRDPAADPPPVRIFTFGGSTMWGYGARDDHTIASYLSKLLHEKGYRVQVTNYGQSDYVSTQEVITLLRCIHREEMPDIVLFYDGIGDVLSSYENDEAGIPRGEWRRRAEFNLTVQPRRLLWALGEHVMDRSLWGFGRVATGLRRRFQATPDEGPRVHPLREEVARQTLHVYETNLTAVEALGEHYEFEPLFYWQPNVFSKWLRPPENPAVARRWLPVKETFDDIYRRVRQSETLNNGHPRFHNISGLFDNLEEPYSVDGLHHLSEAGNRLVAEAMVGDVIDLIEQRRLVATEQAVP